jgi:hypothetical protein
MKKFIITAILAAMVATGTTLLAQNSQEEYLGLPGDNLNLYAVMKLFRESKTLEEFERNLNDQNSNINNLDLDGNNRVDYLRIVDNIDGDVHTIVLQDAVNEREIQDVAVFTVQRFDNGQVMIQLTGDEELYGKNYIIEPIFDDPNSLETPNPGYAGNDRSMNGRNITYLKTTTVEVGAWPLIRFIYLPTYAVWHSSWHWGYYPSYWHPWKPFYWHYYYGYHSNWYNDYYGHYRRWNYHRYSRWNDFYYVGKRSYSRDVNHRIEVGTYKATYSRPNQIKDGEKHFAKSHPDEYRRSLGNSSGNNSVRRSESQSGSSGNSGRSTTVTTRRSTNVTNKAATNPSSDKNISTGRRSSSSNTVTTRSMTNPSSGQNAGTSRTKTQSNSTGVSSSSRRETRKAKTETATKKTDRKKESENKNSDRRK